MWKISAAIKMYLSSKKLIEERIKIEEELLEENNEEVNFFMKDDRYLLNLKVNGPSSYLKQLYDAIRYHQSNIEKLKNGDMELCAYLMTHELKIDRTRREMRDAHKKTRECGTLELYAKRRNDSQ